MSTAIRPTTVIAPSLLAEASGLGTWVAVLNDREAAHRASLVYGTPIYVWENGKVVAKKP